MIVIKSQREIEYMRRSGRIVALALQEIKENLKPGVTTLELDRIALEVIESQGAKAAFKNYQLPGTIPFPGNTCISINEEVVHGIPSEERRIREGDIVSVDIGTIYKGYCGDAARTFPVGEVGEEARKLLRITEEALFRGIDKARAGNRLSDISHAVQSYVEDNGFSVVRDFVGHGIGSNMHEDPQIPNYGPPGRGPRLKVGMVLAIEPMVNVGRYAVRKVNDGWTVVTSDGSLSAHFENTVAISRDGPDILTIIGGE